MTTLRRIILWLLVMSAAAAGGAYTLTISITGSGYVTPRTGSYPNYTYLAECAYTASPCSYDVASGLLVSFSLAQNGGWVFSEWSGDQCNTSGSCAFYMPAVAVNQGAVFAPAPTATPTNTPTVTPTSTATPAATATASPTTTPTPTITPTPTTTPTITSTPTITPTPLVPYLGITIQGAGSVQVSAGGVLLSPPICTTRSSPCYYEVGKTLTVSLFATPALAGVPYAFDHWSGGACDGSTNVACAFLMGPSFQPITAIFKTGSVGTPIPTPTWPPGYTPVPTSTPTPTPTWPPGATPTYTPTPLISSGGGCTCTPVPVFGPEQSGVVPPSGNSVGLRLLTNSYGYPTVWVDAALLIPTPAPSSGGSLSVLENSFDGDGTTTSFTATTAPVTGGTVAVTENGLVAPATAWSVAGSVLTIPTPPASGVTVSWLYYAAAPTGVNFATEDITAAGSTDFTLAHTPVETTLVACNGLAQTGGGWSLVGNVVRFSVAPVAGSTVTVSYRY